MISVFCVDDDPAILFMTKRFLEEPGALTVTTALSAPEALKEMETKRFDAIVSDYQMPGMDGIEFLRAVRAGHPSLPFILFTGKGREEVVIEAFNNGTDFYLKKGGDPKILFATLNDTIKKAIGIRARKKQSHDSEIRYRGLFETARDGILILDAESGKVTDANPLLLTLIGYTRDEIMGKKLWELGVIREKVLAEQAAADLKKSGYIHYDDLPLATKDGRTINVEFVSSAYNADTQNLIQINIREITERKRVEAALRESEEKFRQLFTRMPSAVAIYTAVDDGADFIFKDFNIAAEKIEGIKKDDLIGKQVTQVFPGVKDFGIFPVFQRVWRTGQPEFFPQALYRDEHDPGTWRENWIYKLASGEIVAIYNDITGRRQAEEALRKSEERYRSLAEAIPDQIFIDGRDDTIEYVNAAALKLFNRSYDQVVGRPRKDFFPPEIFKAQEASLHTVFESGESIRREELISFGTRELWIDTILVPLKDAAGRVTSVLGIARDISKRKQAEDALKESATLLNDVGEMVHVGGWELDGTTQEVRWTQETYRIHEIPEDEKINLQKSLLFFDLPGRSTLDASLQRCMEEEEPFDLELPFTSDGGNHLWTRVTGRAVSVGGRVVKLTGTFQDITGRKAAEDTLRSFSENLERTVVERTADLSDINIKLVTEIGIRIAAEKQLTKTVGEKEVLLREVHHRVKNNLQIIISLLNLQSRYITDTTMLSAFRESQNRVRAMALVHEKLYLSKDLARIDFDNYIRFLANNLLQFFGVKAKGIRINMDIKDIFLDTDTAIPLGLIINELISNSLKYAFPEGETGEISLAINKPGHALSILYRDNGIGIPEDFDWRNAESLGLRLVITLVEQLDGTIELDRSSGTAFTIVVKEKE